MNKQRHQRIDLLHSWIGIIVGLLIYIVSFSGVIALFGNELQTWEDPNTRIEIQEEPAPYTPLVDRFVKDIKSELPDDYHVDSVLVLYPKAETPYYYAEINSINKDNEHRKDKRHWNPNTGNIIPDRGNGLTHWLIDFHRRLMLPETLGRSVVGIAGLLLMLSIISGIIIHKNIFKEFFSWRLNRSLRVGWRESHNAIGVWGLPFHFTLAFTGSFLGIVSMLLPIVAFTSFKGDQEKLLAAIGGEEMEAANISAPMLPLNEAKSIVEKKTGKPVLYNFIHHWGDKNASYELFFDDDESLLLFVHSEMPGTDNSEQRGEILETHYAEPNTLAGDFLGAIAPLHYGTYGGIPLKFFYLLLGIGLCVMTASGLGLWMEKRIYGNEGKQSQLTYHLLSRLVAGVTVGLVVSTCALFYTDRLYSGSPDYRLTYTGICFFLVWTLFLVIALFKSNNYHTTKLGLYISALLLIALPVLDKLTSGYGILDAGHHFATAVNFSCIVTGIVLLVVAIGIPSHRPQDYHLKKSRGYSNA